MAERFSLDRFSMNLQSLERTYIDKVFALCDYYLQGKPKHYSRHLYDIYKLAPLIEFNDEFAVLVREVREHRSRMRTLAVRTCLQNDTMKKGRHSINCISRLLLTSHVFIRG